MIKQQSFYSSAYQQKGLSIVEFMVAITLGLLLLVGITQIFLSNKTTFNMTDSMSRLEENGRYAMEILARNIRMAGYADPSTADIPPPFYGECDSTDANCIADDEDCDTGESFCTFDSGDATSDRLAVYYDPVDDVDCIGTAHVGPLVNVFWIANDDTNGNLPSLYCRGFDPNASPPSWIGGGAQPVAPGVENFQVLYGVLPDDRSDITPIRYVNAPEVFRWANVKTVRIGLLMRGGGSGSGPVNRVRRYSVLDAGGDALVFNDNQPRMLYTTTVSINNVVLTND